MSESNSIKPVEYRDLSPFGFPGYRVGDDGSVWSCRKIGKRGTGNGRGCVGIVGDEWKRMRGSRKQDDHLAITMPDKRQVFVHTLVLLAFVGPRPEGMEACHFPDRNPANNQLDNLRWGTRKENAEDCLKHGTQRRGETSGKAKITEDVVKAIRTEYVPPSKGYRGNGVAVARKYGIGVSTLYHIIKRETWDHVA